MSSSAGVLLLALLLLVKPLSAAAKPAARLERIAGTKLQELRVSTRLSAADTCFVTPNTEIVYRIDGWLVGGELYKSYMDPGASCSSPYPFTIHEINMPMAFDAATPLSVSVDVELVDNVSYPGCAIPGEPLSISQEYTLNVPAGGGMFNIWIPLDTPVTVSGPFFAGFFVANAFDPSVNAAVLCDTTPVQCVSYNIWDESIGWVDLTDNPYYNFPGNLAMEASGVPGGIGGGTTQPMPAPAFVAPSTDTAFAPVELWADDTSGSTIIDYISFSYSTDGVNFTEIGRDYDGSSPLRAGRGAVTAGNGFNQLWNTSGLAERTYILKATSVDTLERSSIATTSISLEPTPPRPTILSPGKGSDFCDSLNVAMSCPDENMSYIEVYRKAGAATYHANLTILSQFAAGDNNGNPSDGNLASNGEFGDYYSGPVSAAMALKLWIDRGYSEVGQQGASTLSMPELAESLASRFKTRALRGTYDEQLILGLTSYLAAKGSQLKVDYTRNPDYFVIRQLAEEEERSVIIGVSGPSGYWLALEGFNGWRQGDSSFVVYAASPLTGAVEEIPVRSTVFGYSQIFFNSEWHRIDIAVSVYSPTWTITRGLLKVDFSGSDGWSVDWAASGLAENALLFVRAVGKDANNNRGSATTLLRYNCTSAFTKGDYNNDGILDIADMLHLLEYILHNGPAPSGGGRRADCNCDNTVNVTDAVFYMNYLFGFGTQPCR